MRALRTQTLLLLAVITLVLGGCAPGATTTADTDGAGRTEAPTAVADAAAAPGEEPTVPAEEPSAPSEAPASATEQPEVAADEHHDEAAPHAHEGAATDDYGNGTFTFGEPDDPGKADRTVKVRADDQMRFRPAGVHVHAGEVITFEIENVGNISHDFTLGDEAAQDQHAREMAAMGAGMQHEDPNAVIVEPGETASLTWRFLEGGEVLYGCHQPGHYEAGMVGTVAVAPGHG